MPGREGGQRRRRVEECFGTGIQQEKTVRDINALAGRAMTVRGTSGVINRSFVTVLFVRAAGGCCLHTHEGRCCLGNAGQGGERQQEEYEGYDTQQRVHLMKIQKLPLICQ